MRLLGLRVRQVQVPHVLRRIGRPSASVLVGKGMFEWSVINYGRNIVLAEHGEIDGVARTFYADNNGWVYEADKGRSLAGDPLPYAIKLLPLTQRRTR